MTAKVGAARSAFLRSAFLDQIIISTRRIRLRALRRTAFTSLRRWMRCAE
jgi:hypothetical protein